MGNMKVLLTCEGCGVAFPMRTPVVGSQYQAYSNKCLDCARIALGYKMLTRRRSTSKWWAPWTWGRNVIETYWNSEYAELRVLLNKATRSIRGEQ